MTIDERVAGVKRCGRGLLRRAGFEVVRLPAPAPLTPAERHYPQSPTCQIPNLAFIYELIFGLRRDGTFVEVGAFDGYSFSNTSCLAAAGWAGSYVEPVPASAAACRERHRVHPKVSVTELAIGAVEGSIDIHVGGPLSTPNTELLAEYREVDWAKGSFDDNHDVVSVRQVTLDHFLETQGIEPGLDVLVVDVEGYEPAVFSGFDLARWRPACIIAEIADLHPDLVGGRSEAAHLSLSIVAAGYRIIYKDHINTIFVTDEVHDAAFAS